MIRVGKEYYNDMYDIKVNIQKAKKKHLKNNIMDRDNPTQNIEPNHHIITSLCFYSA